MRSLSSQPAYYMLNELARMMVKLEVLQRQSVAAHRKDEAADLQQLRDDVLSLRMQFVRSRWWDAHVPRG